MYQCRLSRASAKAVLGFLKSPGQGSSPKARAGQLGKEPTHCCTSAHWWVCPGMQWVCRDQTFTAHWDLPLQAHSYRSCRQLDVQRNQHSPPSARVFNMSALWFSTAPFSRDPFQRAPGSWSELTSLFAFLPWVQFPGESAGTSEEFGESRSQFSMCWGFVSDCWEETVIFPGMPLVSVTLRVWKTGAQWWLPWLSSSKRAFTRGLQSST